MTAKNSSLTTDLSTLQQEHYALKAKLKDKEIIEKLQGSCITDLRTLNEQLKRELNQERAQNDACIGRMNSEIDVLKGELKQMKDKVEDYKEATMRELRSM